MIKKGLNIIRCDKQGIRKNERGRRRENTDRTDLVRDEEGWRRKEGERRKREGVGS